MIQTSFQDRLNEQFRQCGDRVAIQYGEVQISYSQLEKKSHRIANRLITEGVTEERFIGVCLDDRIELVSTIIGILLARCVFVILDTRLPRKRLIKMLHSTGTRDLFMDTGNYDRLFAGEEVDALSLNSMKIETFDSPGTLSQRVSGDLPGYDREDRVYVYFTSGSTGTPKGIVGKNKSLLHYIDWERDTFSVDETCIVSQLTTPGFDPFLRDVFLPLCSGATLCIPPYADMIMNTGDFIHWLDTRQIRLIHCVPSVFRMLLGQGLKESNFKGLKNILLAGESMPPSVLKEWYGVFGERIQLVNVYGPTETTLSKTYYLIRESDCNRTRIPVGKPMWDTRVFVMDEEGGVLPPGHVGEIVIGTPFRTFGYHNNEEANKEKFIPDTFSSDAGDLVYKTGDLGKILEDGNIELVGRMDRQVKIRGMRMELEDIEAALLSHPLVNEAVVLARELRGELHLCAYTVCGREVGGEQLRAHMAGELPHNMVPSYYVFLDKIPLNPNGKTDRRALPAPIPRTGAECEPPGNEQEKALRRIWASVLGMDEETIGVNSNFWQLGGHSITSASVVSEIHKDFNVKLSLGSLFEKPTIRQLAACIEDAVENRFVSIEAVEKKEFYPLSSAQKRLYLVQQLEPGSTAYNMPTIFIFDRCPDMETVANALGQLTKRHESLRTSFENVSGQPYQRIHSFDEIELQLESFGTGNSLSAEAGDAGGAVQPFGSPQTPNHSIPIPRGFVRPFDLSAPPLFRAGILKSDGQKLILLMDIHHIITDGASQEILAGEIAALLSGEPLPALGFQYKDYSQWQSRPAQVEGVQKQQEFWLREFSGEIPRLHLPMDFERPPKQSFEGDCLHFTISREQTRQLKGMVKEKDVTLFILIQAIFYVSPTARPTPSSRSR